jgi:hypothetical protein
MMNADADRNKAPKALKAEALAAPFGDAAILTINSQS